VRDARQVGRVRLEDELVDADGDGADEERVELLVVFGAGDEKLGLFTGRVWQCVGGRVLTRSRSQHR
jgi:hypothetical protein